MKSAGRVGFLAVVFIAMLAGAYAILQRSAFAPKTESYFAEFADAGGVAVGARVLLAGVQIGQVEKVELAPSGKARLTLAVMRGTKIPQTSIAVLPTALIGIGDRQIELTPDKPTDAALAPGATIPGELRSPLQAFAPDSEETVKALNQTLNTTTKMLESLNTLVSDQALKQDLQKLLQSSAQTAESFGKLAGRFDQTLAQNQAVINAILRNGQTVSRDLTRMSGSFAKIVESGELQGNLDQVVTKLTGALDAGTAMVQDMRAVINNPELQGSLKEIMANTATMTKTGTEIAENTNTLIEKGIEVGENVNQLMIKANKLADEAGELFDEAKKRLMGLGESSGGVLGGVRNTKVQADVFRETEPNRWRTDLNLEVPLGKNELHLGMWDAFESNKLNLQLGKKFNSNTRIRYGVYGSKAGAGVDYELGNGLGLRGDVFGLNQTRFDLKARYQINRDVHGWLGLDRVFDRNSITFGIGIRP